MSSIIQVKVPVLPESIQDATIAAWHKKPGDIIKRDENLVDLETDKVVLEVPAPADGILKEILKVEGQTVTAQEVLANIQSAVGSAEHKSSNDSKKVKELEVSQDKHQHVKAAVVMSEQKEVKQHKTTSSVQDLSPSARRAASATGVNISTVSGSGKDGRVTKHDILHGNQALSDAAQVRPEKRVPMTRLRAKIADRLVQSQRTAAILTTFNEINMQPVMNIRARYKDEFEKAHGIKLGFMSFFIKATVEALKRSPDVNASIDGNDIVYHGYFDIGVAVSSDRGLVVPIIRDADRKSMAEIEAEIRDFGIRAQKGQLSLEEMTGGTFTVSNGGVFSSLLSTPIINPPQSGILGMHKIEERPIVENKEIVIRPMMYVAMSYDHRIIDGKESVTFLRTIKELLEDPTRLLLDV